MGLPLLDPASCGVVFVDQPCGPAEGAGCAQALLSSWTALARTARVFSLPAVVCSPAARARGGPLLPVLQRALPDIEPVGGRSMNAWEDAAARAAITGMDRRRLLICGLTTEGSVSFLALCAASGGYEVFVVADACGGLTPLGHELALRRMQAAGVLMTSWLQVLLELQRDWTREATCGGARALLEEFAGGSGTGPAYAGGRIMPSPAGAAGPAAAHP
jgi:nicotinamidase-related amidase